MDSFVVMSTSAANSNGFSTPAAAAAAAASALLLATSKSSVDDADTRLCRADDTTSPVSCSTDSGLQSAESQSELPSSAVDLRQLADPCISERSGHAAGTTKDGRAISRQRASWDGINDRMERRRREWNSRVDQLRRDFFRLDRPSSGSADDGCRSSEVVSAEHRGRRRVVDVHQLSCTAPTSVTRQQFQVNTLRSHCMLASRLAIRIKSVSK